MTFFYSRIGYSTTWRYRLTITMKGVFMARNLIIVLLVFSFCFLGFSIGRFTFLPPVGPNVSIAKDIPDLQKADEVERALTMAVIASSNKIAKELAKNLDKQNLTKEAYDSFIKAAKGMKSAGKRKQADPNKIYDVKVDDAPFKGPADAPVTIVEFSEFQCPFCGRAADTLKEIEKDYGDKVRFVFRSKLLPRHSKAPLAHAAAYAAGRQGKFWEMHDKIFSNQKDLTEEAYNKYAKEIGLNLSKFAMDLKDPEIAKEWADDEKESQRIGISSTPTFFVNGKMVRGAKPKEAFVSAIEDALKRANK